MTPPPDTEGRRGDEVPPPPPVVRDAAAARYDWRWGGEGEGGGVWDPPRRSMPATALKVPPLLLPLPLPLLLLEPEELPCEVGVLPSCSCPCPCPIPDPPPPPPVVWVGSAGLKVAPPAPIKPGVSVSVASHLVSEAAAEFVRSGGVFVGDVERVPWLKPPSPPPPPPVVTVGV